jgi:pectate lyase-like protein
MRARGALEDPRACAALISFCAVCAALGDSEASRASDTEPVVRPESFGAHPDDGIDDTAAIQAAIDSMTGGGTLAFSRGTYLHDDQILVRKSDVRLVGDEATLHATSAENQAITIEGRNIGLYGLTITADSRKRLRSDRSSCILIYRSDGVEIRDNHVSGCASVGIHASARSKNFIIQGNIIEDTFADGIHVTDRASHGQVTGNVTTETGDDGIAVVGYLKQKGLVTSIRIADNQVLGTRWGRGITVQGADDVVVENNYVERTSAAGILCASDAGYGLYGVTRARFIRNVVSEANYEATVLHGGILLKGREGSETGEDGTIRDYGIEDILVQGNTIIDTIQGSAHVRIGPYGSNIRIVENTIIDTDSSKPALDVVGHPDYAASENSYNERPMAEHVLRK